MAIIGFIGLGNMGAPMATNLARAGHQVHGFDVVGTAADGVRPARHIEDAVADADIVLTMLPAGLHVREVMEGVFAHAKPGALIIDSSTIDVATARDMHDAAAASSFPMLDAPVSGGTAGAAAGTLTFMVGGADEAFALGRPVLAQMGRTVVHAGGPGAGQAAKLCNNLILGISMIGVSEAFALAARLGLSAQSLFDIASTSSGQCWSLTNYCPVPGPVPASPANKDYAAGFATSLMLKDLTLATGAQEDTGAAAVLGPVARAFYQRLENEGLGGKDFSVAARALGGE